MKKPYFITTAIDYVNGAPHVGHGLEKIQADCFARYARAVGKDVRFLTGTDENSIKNVQAAEADGITPGELVDKNAELFENLVTTLNLSNDDFIRTTEKRHFDGAQKLWRAFRADDLYKKAYTGLYCNGCEEFKLEKDLVEEKCSEHMKAPEQIEEENWFFRLSRYQEQLQELIENDTLHIYPQHRKNEVLSFVKGGLEDFSVSRSVARAKNWGVPVPGDEEQMMYVWVDALSNYITALDYATDGALYKKYWDENKERVHVIGKGILRFHAVYWPAMLLSAGLPIPTKIYAHEYFTVEGQKMSKSLGNVLSPNEIVDKYGTDGARYVLLTALPYTDDGDVCWKRMSEKYNADLANGLGNLVSRVLVLAGDLAYEKIDVDVDISLGKEMDVFNIPAALAKVLEIVDKSNKFIDMQKPWELKKDRDERKRFEEVMQKLLQDLHIISVLLTPFLPETAEKIVKALETREKVILFERI